MRENILLLRNLVFAICNRAMGELGYRYIKKFYDNAEKAERLIPIGLLCYYCLPCLLDLNHICDNNESFVLEPVCQLTRIVMERGSYFLQA